MVAGLRKVMSSCSADEQRRLTEIAGRIRNCKHEVVGKLLEIGAELQHAHKILEGKGPGAFPAWASLAPVSLKRSQAHAYLAAYRQFNDCPKITHQLSDTSLLKLASNDKAAEEAKSIVTKGEKTLTPKDVNDLLTKHKAPKNGSAAKPAPADADIETDTLTDANGVEVPKKFRKDFDAVAKFTEAERLLREARGIIKSLDGKNAAKHIRAIGTMVSQLDTIITKVHDATPYALTEDGSDWIPVGKAK